MFAKNQHRSAVFASRRAALLLRGGVWSKYHRKIYHHLNQGFQHYILNQLPKCMYVMSLGVQ